MLEFTETSLHYQKFTASQILKRLNSYAKHHPLYAAFKEFGRIIKTIFVLTYINDMELRQMVQKQLNRIELSNKFSSAVFFANNQEFGQSLKGDQEIAASCMRLIQNSIVLWNYLYLSKLLINCEDDEKNKELLTIIENGSIMTWQHTNFLGEYDFRKYAGNDDQFDMERILSLKLNKVP